MRETLHANDPSKRNDVHSQTGLKTDT